MFHTYIIARSGRKIDFDRARLTMDDALLNEAHKSVIASFASPFDRAVADRMGINREARVRRVWIEYCRRHREKYNEEFEPDASPTWDT